VTTKQQELVYEAIASALYNNPFCRFEGEYPGEDGRDVWRGTLQENPQVYKAFRNDPKQVRLAIKYLREDFVIVTVIWRNVAMPENMTGLQELRIHCKFGEDLRQAAEAAVVRCLEVFRDVLGGTGVAGELKEGEEPEIDPETDLARTDEEVGRE